MFCFVFSNKNINEKKQAAGATLRPRHLHQSCSTFRAETSRPFKQPASICGWQRPSLGLSWWHIIFFYTPYFIYFFGCTVLTNWVKEWESEWGQWGGGNSEINFMHGCSWREEEVSGSCHHCIWSACLTHYCPLAGTGPSQLLLCMYYVVHKPHMYRYINLKINVPSGQQWNYPQGPQKKHPLSYGGHDMIKINLWVETRFRIYSIQFIQNTCVLSPEDT